MFYSKEPVFNVIKIAKNKNVFQIKLINAIFNHVKAIIL